MIRLRFLLFCVASVLARAQGLEQLEKKIAAFTLPNGLRFVIAERHVSPIASFRTYVNAGAVDVRSGETGLAKLIERLAGSGSETVGSANWPAEKKLLDDVEEAYDRLDAERRKGLKANDVNVMSLQIDLQKAIDRASALQHPGEYAKALQQGGAMGIVNAASVDSLQYAYTLPSSRLELWFLLESQRLFHPVLRDFYKQRDALASELRAADSNPQARLLNALPAAAFQSHPYRNPVTGWPGDVENLRAADARAFYQAYFVPGNIVCAVVGDVAPAEVQRLAERYFGPLPARPLPPQVRTVEPSQPGPRSAVAGVAAQSLVAIAYKRPDFRDRDDAVFDILEQLLAGDRQSLLYKEMIETRPLASSIRVLSSFPGGRYPSLFTAVFHPVGSHTPEELRTAFTGVLARLQNAPVDPAALVRARATVRENLVTRLADNEGLAQALATYVAVLGDWHKIGADLEAINRVKAEDVQRVAIKYLTPDRSTMVSVVQPAPVSVPSAPKELP